MKKLMWAALALSLGTISQPQNTPKADVAVEYSPLYILKGLYHLDERRQWLGCLQCQPLVRSCRRFRRVSRPSGSEFDRGDLHARPAIFLSQVRQDRAIRPGALRGITFFGVVRRYHRRGKRVRVFPGRWCEHWARQEPKSRPAAGRELLWHPIERLHHGFGPPLRRNCLPHRQEVASGNFVKTAFLPR